MTEINLETPLGISKIEVKRGLFKTLRNDLQKKFPEARFIVILTDHLESIYGKKLEQELPGCLKLVIQSGENGKSMETVVELCAKMMEAGISRHDVLIGFGGGMITDVAGFVASIYLRGIHYIAMPTTLLGMADAAIGGKNGVDFKGIKNILGTFYPPDFILCDPDFLDSLPEREKRNGMGEVVKYAPTLDTSLFEDFEENPLPIDRMIEKSIQCKVKVVKADPLEEGVRKFLNYGHTFGHAIETKSGYKVSHGEGVAMGMVISNRIAQKLGKQKPEVGAKIEATLKKFGLPTTPPAEIDIASLEDLIAKDKKRVGDHITFVIVTELGKPELVNLTPQELVKLAQE